MSVAISSLVSRPRFHEGRLCAGMTAKLSASAKLHGFRRAGKVAHRPGRGPRLTCGSAFPRRKIQRLGEALLRVSSSLCRSRLTHPSNRWVAPSETIREFSPMVKHAIALLKFDHGEVDGKTTYVPHNDFTLCGKMVNCLGCKPVGLWNISWIVIQSIPLIGLMSGRQHSVQFVIVIGRCELWCSTPN